MRVPTLLLATLPTLALFLQGCPSCPYNSTCEGNVLKSCFVGVDQLVGSPEESERACEGPNPVCVAFDEQNATCAIAPERSCATGTLPRCEGSLLVSCAQPIGPSVPQGLEVATDCTADGNVCSPIDGKDLCHVDPVEVCGTDFAERCDGARALACSQGVVVAEDCAQKSQSCKVSTTDYGTSAYCSTL